MDPLRLEGILDLLLEHAQTIYIRIDPVSAIGCNWYCYRTAILLLLLLVPNIKGFGFLRLKIHTPPRAGMGVHRGYPFCSWSERLIYLDLAGVGDCGLLPPLK